MGKAIIGESLYRLQQMLVAEICRHSWITKRTFYKYLKLIGVGNGKEG